MLDALLTTLPILHKWDSLVEFAGQPGDALAELQTWRSVLIGEGHVLPDRDRLLTRLLQLEVASTALGDEVTTGATLPVEVVQLSSQTQNASCRYTRSGDDKLGGMSVNRFGGFLKRSWRVNDWTWGRLDAATVLCRTVLQPARVRRTALLSGYLTDGRQPAALAEATVAEVMTHFGDLTKVDSRLQRLRGDSVDELSRVLDPSQAEGDLPAAMPALAHLFAWALHLQIVAEEMPTLAAAIRADGVEGANARSNGEILLEEQSTLLARLEAAQRAGKEPGLADRAQALEAFDRAGVGRETLSQEVSSDLTIRTATTAAAVGATVIDSNRAGLRAAKPVTRALRGGMLLPYWVITALTSRAALARGLALLGLAVGAALLVLALFGALPSGLSGPATAIGASATLVAFAYGALRTGTMLHGLVLLTPVVPLLAYAAAGAVGPPQGGDQPDEHGVSTLLVVVALAAALMVLGSLPATRGSVWATLDRLADREGVAADHSPMSRRSEGLLRWVVGDLLAPLLVFALVLAVVWLAVDQRTDLVPFLREHWWLGLVALAALAAGGFAAAKSGSQLQVLRERRTSEGAAWSYETLAHPAGAAAGWSVLYGSGYLVFAAFLVWDPFEWSSTASSQALLITSLVLFVVLVVVLPLLLPVRALREAVRREEERARTVPAFALPQDDPAGTGPTARDDRALAVDLANRGVAYRWFVSESSAWGLAPPSLTGHGEMLGKRISKARATGATKERPTRR